MKVQVQNHCGDGCGISDLVDRDCEKVSQIDEIHQVMAAISHHHLAC